MAAPSPHECSLQTSTEATRERFGPARTRAALRGFADSAAFLRTPEGAEFVLQLEHFLAPSMLALARNVGVDRSWLQTDDVVHTVIVRLAEDHGGTACRIADTAIDPWGYLARCAAAWMRTLWGVRAEHNEVALMAHPQPQAEPATTLTSLAEVVTLAHAVLAPHTEARLREPLRRLLLWLAHNPPQRLSHETQDRAAAAQQFPEFTPAQLTAVVNISWGGRPRRDKTSLFAALLLRPDFHPSDSPSHARALLHYRRSMRLRQLHPLPQSERLAA